VRWLDPGDDAPLWEGELAPAGPDADGPSRGETGQGSVRALPQVSIGRPQVWPIHELFTDAELPAEIRARLSQQDYYLARFACSFRTAPGEPHVEWARFSVTLAPDPEGRQPFAIELHPRSITGAVQHDLKFGLKPTLKFAEVELGGAEAEVGLHYTALEPVVTAAGLGEAIASWDYQATRTSMLEGPKEMHVVIEAPAGMRTADATISLAADLVHRGLRLTAAFRRRGAQDVQPLTTRLWG